uniref:Amyloid beta A4 protein-binding family B member 2 n=1 Tax=Lygus hesperus TaxID=30085 RepID=A0A146LW99_LYGHE
MLCGELGGRIHPHFDFSGTQNPYSTLLTLYTMVSTPPAEETYLENGLLSYENPNYHLPNLDDAINSNTDVSMYRDLLYSELETICRPNATSHGRKSYASLDLGSMGVDLNTGPVTALDKDTSKSVAKRPEILDNNGVGNLNRGSIRSIDAKISLLSSKPDLVDDKDTGEDVDEEKDNGDFPEGTGSRDSPESSNDESSAEVLPPGWEKHQDSNGPYYWHVKSGTIQRDLPVISGNKEPKTPLVKDAEKALTNFHQDGGIMTVTRSNSSSVLAEFDLRKYEERERKEDMALKRRSFPARCDNKDKEKSTRFAVRSLGWVEICESDLTPERSSRAVNRCILELSAGKHGFIDNVGRWGDGKDLFMDLDEGALKLIDPESLTILNTQPIHTIRVWGVVRDNGRDFAYVARDRITRKHMCHVFRCDMPARAIANTLRDICKRIMIERTLQQHVLKPIESSIPNGKPPMAVRPTNLPTESRKFHRNSNVPITQSFPTPMEEPKKTLQAEYLGTVVVARPNGMDVLNDAIDQLVNTIPRSQWQIVNISVAPSMITITSANHQDGDKPIAECRVRYLSFLGVGHNVKQCAFIMHTAQDLFVTHVFHCEPSSGALCKTIEAACKLRYQKCLDAHPQGGQNVENESPTKGLGATLKSFVGSITGRRMKKS